MAQKSPNAEEILRKEKNEMSDIERMMADIINGKSDDNGFQETAQDAAEGQLEEVPAFSAESLSPAPPERNTRIQKTPESNASPKASYIPDEPFEYEDEDAVSAYSTALKAERERKIASQVKRRRIRPVSIILTLCGLLVIGAIVFSALREDLPNSFPGAAGANYISVDNSEEETEHLTEPETTLPPDMVIPTPESQEAIEAGTVKVEPPNTIVIMSDTKQQATTAEGVDPEQGGAETAGTQPGTVPGNTSDTRYEFFVEDVSWEEAKQRCLDRGGWLVTIGDEAELEKIILLANEFGIEKMWIGCHRENGELRWENGENISFYQWGNNEPSYYDSGDNVAEDYLLLWRLGGKWVYNDSRNNPVIDYPDMYSGQIAYVCEYYNG